MPKQFLKQELVEAQEAFQGRRDEVDEIVKFRPGHFGGIEGKRRGGRSLNLSLVPECGKRRQGRLAIEADATEFCAVLLRSGSLGAARMGGRFHAHGSGAIGDWAEQEKCDAQNGQRDPGFGEHAHTSN